MNHSLEELKQELLAHDHMALPRSFALEMLRKAYRTGQEEGRNEAVEKDVKHLVDRFLQWKLPDDFNPDCGIHFDAEAARKINPVNHRYEPTGTNLLTATQAEVMVRHMLEVARTNQHDV